ncbi:MULTISPECIES: DUF4942 domain-containing protein [Vibrio]|uniref:DUF4942 domain-containing protein n=1 Tax=Vibrio TaxID=662 RepID=UPI0024BC9D5A|nr:DUF4942 domain-containing protein [Vibrio parahaemolyticus]WHT05991.1 DUF4942 domain-containing protein [Vibrio parahaemolyticus]
MKQLPVEAKLIESLVQKRTQFIDVYATSLILHKKAIQLSHNIDCLIPDYNQSYPMSFDFSFSKIAQECGETSSNRIRFIREVTLHSMCDEDVIPKVTKVVDGLLWEMLFNRLGLLKLMSKKQSDKFNNDCNENPQPFVLDIVESTLASFYETHGETMLEALMDSFAALSGTYTSNDGVKFGKRVIVDDAFIEYGGHFKVNSFSPLETLLGIVWRWILANRLAINENGLARNGILDELEVALKGAGLDYSEIDNVESHGITFRFFKKKTVHILFPDSMIELMNDQLAKSNALPGSVR